MSAAAGDLVVSNVIRINTRVQLCYKLAFVHDVALNVLEQMSASG